LRQSLDNYISRVQYNQWKKKEIAEIVVTQSFEDKSRCPSSSEEPTKTREIYLLPSQTTLFQKSTKSGLLENNFEPKLLKVIIEVGYWTKI
jgi:hypothetical protein